MAETDSIYPAIDLEKSIKRHRLVYTLSFGFIFIAIVTYMMILIWLFLGFSPVLSLIQNTHPQLWFVILGPVVDIWLLTGIFYRDALIRIPGKNPSINRQRMSETLDAFYEDLEFQIDNDDMMRSYLPTGRPVWGRIITVIFDKNDILLNITKLGKADNPTFMHGLICHLKAKKIATYFKEQYAN